MSFSARSMYSAPLASQLQRLPTKISPTMNHLTGCRRQPNPRSRAAPASDKYWLFLNCNRLRLIRSGWRRAENTSRWERLAGVYEHFFACALMALDVRIDVRGHGNSVAPTEALRVTPSESGRLCGP